MGKARYYTWICPVCNEVFKTRKLLYKHWEEYPTHHIKKSSATHKGEYYCQYCGRFCDQLNSLHLHEKSCKLNPNRVDGCTKGVKQSAEFRKKRSEDMKKRHRLGITPTLSQLRKRELPSYPEQWLMRLIENEGLNPNYKREYKFHTFSLDFVWEDERKVIEMDGRFHKISPYQIDCDKRKDALLKEEGWEELRIDWEYCCNNTLKTIEIIKKFLESKP